MGRRTGSTSSPVAIIIERGYPHSVYVLYDLSPQELSKQIEGHTICALGDAAAWPVQVPFLSLIPRPLRVGPGNEVSTVYWYMG